MNHGKSHTAPLTEIRMKNEEIESQKNKLNEILRLTQMFSTILVFSISKCKPHIGTYNNQKCCSFNTSQFCPTLNFI